MQDTIIALSTPEGEAALAVIRLSGKKCPSLAEAVFGMQLKAREAQLADYCAVDDQVLDQVIASRFEEGHSYTGEAMLELSCHGNPLIVKEIIDDCLKRGCQIAAPGEFTKRAFLNGKIDLSQAEAVAELIVARNKRALASAQRQLAGSLSQRIDGFVADLLQISAQIEAYIDFPEEDMPPENDTGPIRELSELVASIQALISTRSTHQVVHHGLRAVIAGLPNAGKSSLLNALLGQERAIVSSQPGTTRDYLSESIIIGGMNVELVDTAGLRETNSEIEEAGVAKTLEHIEHADFVLYVIDSSNPPASENQWEKLFHVEQCIVIENKCDLNNSKNLSTILRAGKHVRLSATTGEGVEELKQAWASMLKAHYPDTSGNELIVNARHAEALKRACAALGQALENNRQGLGSELIAAELREGLNALSDITGRIDNETMLDLLFSSFCIGK